MTPQIERHLTAGAHMSKKDIIVGNFLGGLAWGLGTVIGATVVAAIVIYILSTVGVFQPISNVLKQVPSATQQTKDNISDQ